MAAADPRVKQIKIKTGVVKRITKERSMYEKEIEANEARVEDMKAQGKDEYEVRKQVEVLQESKAMIPDTKKRLVKAYAELDEMLKKEDDLKELEEYQQALEALENAKPAME